LPATDRLKQANLDTNNGAHIPAASAIFALPNGAWMQALEGP
jgi:hypothetical protein